MTVLDDVRNLIPRLAPEAVCDNCIAERLQLSVRQNANHKTRELAGSGGFERGRGPCSLCGGDKLVICRRCRRVQSPLDRSAPAPHM